MVIIQEEAQSLHWAKTQCTIHSCVLWRPVVPDDSSNDSHVKEHWLIISDDLSHDHHFVQQNIENIILPELKQIGCSFSVLHQRTDGCSGQYKSKNSFADVSESENILQIKRIANYSASGHGKGEVDQAAGFLKTEAKRAVISDVNLLISNAKDLYNFAVSSLTERQISETKSLHKRRFFFVPKDTINHERDLTAYYTVPSTRKLHSVSSVGQDGVIKVRQLSCYCVPCINNKYGECENSEYVEEFKDVVFSTAPGITANQVDEVDSVNDTDIDEALNDSNAGLVSLICFDTVVAIMPSEQSLDDYYLLHITSDGVVTLDQDETSDYGLSFSKGSEIIVGHFYKYQRSTRKYIAYKRDSKKAIVHKSSVLYVGVELTKNAKNPQLYHLQSTDHDDIMCSVSIQI